MTKIETSNRRSPTTVFEIAGSVLAMAYALLIASNIGTEFGVLSVAAVCGFICRLGGD